MANDDGSVQVTFNGEIYNFRELRAELEGKGHRFRSRSDTEVLLRLYEEIGDGLIDRLDGDFAFGLWDDRKRRLLLPGSFESKKSRNRREKNECQASHRAPAFSSCCA